MDTKTKRRTPPGEPGYHRLTDEKRIIIETLRKEGRSLSYIAAIIGMLGAVPKSMLKSPTFDNGKEFAEFWQLEQALGLKVEIFG